MNRTIVLSDFRSVNPTYFVAQADSLAWIASAHARAEKAVAQKAGADFDEEAFRARTARHLARFGCGADKIESRGHELGEGSDTNWAEMDLNRNDESAEGAGMLERTRFFDDHARRVFSRLYAEEAPSLAETGLSSDASPADIVHVTCTGYVSPSAAQRLVSEKRWGDHTRVTHAYHMGCYAAFPALRIAGGLANAENAMHAGGARRADVVHTEMCTLHFNPRLHGPEQLVVQSLFADGFIRYSVQSASAYDGRSPALTLLAQEEMIVPDSCESMSWICSSWGMQMTLARDVPEKLAIGVGKFVARLCEKAGLSEESRAKAVYAVHPGGPKILDRVRDVLAIDESQIAVSRKVLRERGNMSSATIPHVWMEIARARDVEDGRAIVSLAFGPGLTLCGTVMRKGVA